MATAPSDTADGVPTTNGQSAAVHSEPEPQSKEDLTPKAKDIFLLARQQNFPVAMKLLETHPELWLARDDEGHSLLHWGALVGSVEFCKAALASGVEVDNLAENGQTPLMWAVLRGHVQVSRLLLDHKASLHVRDSLGATPLMIAIQHRNYQSMLLIMHRGNRQALLADCDKNGCSCIHWASYKGDLTALKLLDYFDADPLVLDNSKMLPLHRAVCASQGAVVEFLLEKRSDVTLRNGDGKTIMDIADEQNDGGMQALLKKLLSKDSSSGGGSGSAKDVEIGGDQDMLAEDEKAKKKKNEGVMKTLMKAGQDKTAQKAFPVFWLVCVSLATFEYIMDLRRTSYEVVPTAAMLFEIGVPLSLAFFFWVAFSDPGKLPARAKGHSGVEELMRALDGGMPEDQVPDINRLCTTTWNLKGLRTKYCAQTGACVEEFDHWCVWLNSAIGKNNHRQFFGLAMVEWMTQLCHIYVCWSMARALVKYQTIGSWLFGVVSGYPLLALIGAIQCLTAPFILMLIVYQGRLVAMNLTTNEMMNAHRYPHFWVTAAMMPGRLQKMYRNPFNKGSIPKNCLDFWWGRGRSQAVEQPAAMGCQSQSCQGCHQSHSHHHH